VMSGPEFTCGHDPADWVSTSLAIAPSRCPRARRGTAELY
jgi:hypothetical protein